MKLEETTEKMLISGMREDEQSTFIVVQQNLVYQMLDLWKQKQEFADDALSKYEEAKSEADYQKSRVLSILRFLSIYNRGAHEDWFSELGFDENGAVASAPPN